mgnify:CR=1 FL=1
MLQKREQTSDQPAGTVIDQNLAKGYKSRSNRYK